jgi:hypothetical protein
LLNRALNVECARSAVGECDGSAEFFHVDLELPTS